ncbi:hypothetical protein GCM10010970_38090 [Silvimonas iriomotensis]|uniref:Uncharacterized protein n=1 Tax=Silvimonas iriomotensis TaxID=449662 RepID=A0ABQ2PE26_9NEIS|nr:hypothetical protein GCM10010970_38090 [Silvimonas iriomotensis]
MQAGKHPHRVAARNVMMQLAPGRTLLRLNAFGMFSQLVREECHGQPLVGMLTALSLNPHADAGGNMRGANGGFRFVYMLTTRARCATRFETDTGIGQ